MARGSRRAASKVQSYALIANGEEGSDDDAVAPNAQGNSDDEFSDAGAVEEPSDDDDFEDEEAPESAKKGTKRKRSPDSAQSAKPSKVKKTAPKNALKRKSPAKPVARPSTSLVKPGSANVTARPAMSAAPKSSSGAGSKPAARPASAVPSRATTGPGKGKAAGGKSGADKVQPIKSEAEAKKVLREYMRRQNVPHSSTTVSTNLRGRIPKPSVIKLLSELAQANDANPNCMPDLIEKTYGKAKIYFWNQNLFSSDEMSADNLAKLSKRAEALQAEEKSLKENLKALQGNLSSLAAQMTDEALDEEIARLQGETTDMAARLESVGTAAPVSPDHCKKLRKKIQQYEKTTKTRRSAAFNVVDMIADGMGSNRKKVSDLIGLELDE
eukprot:scaffold7339_cov249-Pinguiococcus_pyrenoidosus.AAC.23